MAARVLSVHATPNLRVAFRVTGLVGVPLVFAARVAGIHSAAAAALTAAGCLAAAALFAIGAARMRVVVDDGGVVVTNLFTVTRVGWTDVRGFRLDEGFPYIGRLEVADGGDVALWGISDEPWLRWGRRGRSAPDTIDALNAAFRQVLVGAEPGSPDR